MTFTEGEVGVLKLVKTHQTFEISVRPRAAVLLWFFLFLFFMFVVFVRFGSAYALCIRSIVSSVKVSLSGHLLGKLCSLYLQYILLVKCIFQV